MDIFKFRECVIEDYKRFTRSFTKIFEKDIKEFLDDCYSKERYWQQPLIQLNPHYETRGNIQDLVDNNILHPKCAEIFRVRKNDANPLGEPLTLYKHQYYAINFAKEKKSYVVTSGTGSGKSLSYFIPITDHILREKELSENRKRTKAIVIYPMNALANSQIEELNKFMFNFSSSNQPLTYGRYTGQESGDERKFMAENPPDIILTNYMMLELLLTRQDEIDRKVIENCAGLDFLVLDELHTYRGRQGADVSLLVRRVREVMNQDLVCVGTSATMSSEGGEQERKKVVAEVASKLFGQKVSPDTIITESLRRITSTTLEITHVKKDLKRCLEDNFLIFSEEEVLKHPLSIWLELTLGLERDGSGKFIRAKPLTIISAAQKLSVDAEIDQEAAERVIKNYFLSLIEREAATGKTIFAFKLHQFISGAGQLYSTLEEPGVRKLTLDGQVYWPEGNRDKLLFNTYFCRECGQDYVPVWINKEGTSIQQVTPRLIDDREPDNDDVLSGFVTSDKNLEWSEDFPEEWLNEDDELKREYRKYAPIPAFVTPAGQVGHSGMTALIIPGRFRFCLRCGTNFGARGKDTTRLVGLSSEGRSSATTAITLSSLKYLYQKDTTLSDREKKILAFTDNRQDAALQAAHFNDFIQVLMLRSGLIGALKISHGHNVDLTNLTELVFKALGFDEPVNRREFLYPDKLNLRGLAKQQLDALVKDILGYRLIFDLRRGWRVNNPNLEQLELLKITYHQVDEMLADSEVWKDSPQALRSLATPLKKKVVMAILDYMRRGLAISSKYIDYQSLESLKNQSFSQIKEPWGFSDDEDVISGKYLYLGNHQAGRLDVLSGSIRSLLGRDLKKEEYWGERPDFRGVAGQNRFIEVVRFVLNACKSYGIVTEKDVDLDESGYQLEGSAIVWNLNQPSSRKNQYFTDLYQVSSDLLINKEIRLTRFEAREHTAQVEAEDRELRESLFRYEARDKEKFHDKQMLPLLFCSPTMELGVDISALNTVYLRNVPPTPANYAQRSGRAGRSGQPAFVITYCVAQSPHDQYFYQDPARMVHGVVEAPALELDNQEMIRSHIHAIWLAESRLRLDASIKGLLDLSDSNTMPLKKEIVDVLSDESLATRTLARSLMFYNLVRKDILVADWFNESWVESTVKNALSAFGDSLNRWREMYRAVQAQIKKASEIINSPTNTQKDRDEAKRRLDQAYGQQRLLLADSTSQANDFYTYRYLASQGFLPGYNFPRLPLMAYIPSLRGKEGGQSYLSRPRFLGLSEFGPYSLIYHEGHRFRVVKADIKPTTSELVAGGNRLPTDNARICMSCGYGHFGTQWSAEICLNCGSSLSETLEVHHLFRVENVSTKRVERITADEEERQRQGYEMLTTLQFSSERGRLQKQCASIGWDGEDRFDLTYGPVSTVWRINLGWKRRKIKNIYGFNINPNTGYWTKDEQGATDLPSEDRDSKTPPQRIVPFVEDRKNVLIIKPKFELSETALVSFQYAIKRAIEEIFQLEESELIAESLPRRDKRKAILLYEGAEGGAGVLVQLISKPELFKTIARKAIEIIHYDISSSDELKDNFEGCSAGCYRCLLSYYNQPDHVLIDRKDSEMHSALVGLLDLEVSRSDSAKFMSPILSQWISSLTAFGIKSPNSTCFDLSSGVTADAWYEEDRVVIFVGREIEDENKRILESKGILLVSFSKDSSDWPEQFKKLKALVE